MWDYCNFNAITSKRVVARTRNKDLKKVLGDKEKSVRSAVTKDLEKSKEEKKN